MDKRIMGVNKRWYPTEPGWGDPMCLCTVLVAGDERVGDYAAYQGLGDRPEWIMEHGDKIHFDEACVHFPGGQLDAEKYRS